MVEYEAGVIAFNLISSYRFNELEYCRAANPELALEMFTDAYRVDSLPNYTVEMYDILTDIVLSEWFGIKRPRSKLPWGIRPYFPQGNRLLYCLDRVAASKLQSEITNKYLSIQRDPEFMSIFAGYGLSIPDDFALERNGLSFLARQREYFRSSNEFVLIIQDTRDSFSLD